MNSDFDKKLFIEFDLLKDLIISESIKIKEMTEFNSQIIKSIEPLILEDFKLNFLQKIIYFKIYQYRFKSKLISNKDGDLHKRYVVSIIDKLHNLKICEK